MVMKREIPNLRRESTPPPPNPDLSTRSQSLYQLSYPSAYFLAFHYIFIVQKKKKMFQIKVADLEELDL
jgi:hypothetical protein